jgi:pseudouridine kinase
VALVTVVGGANIDIQGFPRRRLRMGDSNPGSVRVSAGGVGRNIAENLARLGHKVCFISVFGDDEHSRLLFDSLEGVGVDTTRSITLEGHAASLYLCILDVDGALHVAVSDMEIIERLDATALGDRADVLTNADLCVCDANLSSQALESAIALSGKVPVLLDTVSVAKAARASDSVGQCFAVKPNRSEIEVLSGIAIGDDSDLDRAARLLHRWGTRWIFVSLGERGLYFSDGATRGVAAGPRARVLNVSGAGDAQTAALADGIASGRPIAETAARAAAAAALTTETEETVSPRLSPDTLRDLSAAVDIDRWSSSSSRS